MSFFYCRRRGEGKRRGEFVGAALVSVLFIALKEGEKRETASP